MATYPKELTDLVKEYLTDGIITSKERQVLLKKAEALGINTEEFDLYIDAQQQKVDIISDAAQRKAKGQTCPFCGASIPMLADKCPECGALISPEATKEVITIIEKLESALVKYKSGEEEKESQKAVIERYVRKAELYYGNNPKIKILLNEVKAESKKVSQAINRKKAATNLVKWIKRSLCLLVIGYFLSQVYAAFSMPDFRNLHSIERELDEQASILLERYYKDDRWGGYEKLMKKDIYNKNLDSKEQEIYDHIVETVESDEFKNLKRASAEEYDKREDALIKAFLSFIPFIIAMVLLFKI